MCIIFNREHAEIARYIVVTSRQTTFWLKLTVIFFFKKAYNKTLIINPSWNRVAFRKPSYHFNITTMYTIVVWQYEILTEPLVSVYQVKL